MAVADAKREEVTISDAYLETLDKDFETVMRDLSGVEDAARFRAEYETLHRALQKSHESEQRFVQRCQELTQDMMVNAAKMQAAVKLSQGDHSTIEALKREVEKAWRMVDAAHDKETRAKDTIKGLRQEVSSLKNLVETGSSTATPQGATLDELRIEHASLQVDCDELLKQVEDYTQRIKEANEQLKQAEAAVVVQTGELQQMTERHAVMKSEHEREVAGRDRTVTQVRDLTITLQSRTSAVQTQKEKLHALDADNESGRDSIAEVKRRLERVREQTNTMEEQLYHTRHTCEDTTDTLTEINAKEAAIQEETLAIDSRMAELKYTALKDNKDFDRDFKEEARVTQQLEDVRHEHEAIEGHKVDLQKRIQSVRAAQKEVETMTDLISKEHVVLRQQGNRELRKKEEVEQGTQAQLENRLDIEAALDHEVAAGNSLRVTIEKLERERDKFIEASSQIGLLHTDAKTELQTTVVRVAEAKRQLGETEEKLAAQHRHYEQMRKERNQYAKRLVEVLDIISELKQKHGTQSHQIELLKEEHQIQERKHCDEVAKEKVASEKLRKLRRTIDECTRSYDHAQKESDSVQQRIRQLTKVVRECDNQLTMQQKQISTVTRERDLLGSQLVRRNDELALLYEKMRLQQNLLRDADEQAHGQLDDARALGVLLTDTARNAAVAEARARDLQGLKEKLKQTLDDLASEQAHAKDLADELENPKNASRWRVVPGEDPSVEDIRRKSRADQKRLLAKTEECVSTEMELQEKKNLILELRAVLERQPGADAARLLNMRQRQLNKQGAMVKQHASELNATTTQITALRYDTERLRRELNEATKAYYEYKMKNESLLSEGKAADSSTHVSAAEKSSPRRKTAKNRHLRTQEGSSVRHPAAKQPATLPNSLDTTLALTVRQVSRQQQESGTTTNSTDADTSTQ